MSDSLFPVKMVPFRGDIKKSEQVFLSSYLIRKLGLNKEQSLTISFGKILKSIKVHPFESDHKEIYFSDSIVKELLIPKNMDYKFLVKYNPESQTLHIGPVIALLTDIQSNQKDSPLFRSIHTFCEELQEIVKEMGGFFYVFCSYDFSEDGVSGYYFENGDWVFSKLPLPDVIYNRVHSRRLEHIPLFTSFRKKLELLNIPLFNDRFLSKWEVYQLLMLDEQIHPYIPETNIFSHHTLNEFIAKYHSVYLKPVYGSLGRNIIRLLKEEENIICQTSQTSISNKYKSSEISHQLKPLLHNRIYIIQQGILLAEYQDRAMDFRILVHKNLQHLWKVTSLVARISAEQQFVSNLAKGGTIMKPFNALNTCFNREMSSKLISAMKELSLQAAAAISSQAKGITGELGIDIGVDHSGNPWIIEVNSKPSKGFEDNQLKIRPSAKAIIQFCTQLAFDGDIKLEEKA